MSTGIVCSVCLFLYPLSCPISPLLAQSRCGQAVLASFLIDNSQQGPSQGERPDSFPPNTPGRLRAVVQAVNHRQLYRHHQALTGSYLPTAQISFFHWKACRRAYTCSCGTNSQALLSPALIHVNELLQSAKKQHIFFNSNTFVTYCWGLEQSARSLFLSLHHFLLVSVYRSDNSALSRCMQNEGSSKRSDAVKLDALTSVWRASLCRML